MDLLTPSSPGGIPTLSLTTNSSWLPWEVCHASLMPVPAPLLSLTAVKCRLVWHSGTSLPSFSWNQAMRTSVDVMLEPARNVSVFTREFRFVVTYVCVKCVYVLVNCIVACRQDLFGYCVIYSEYCRVPWRCSILPNAAIPVLSVHPDWPVSSQGKGRLPQLQI